MRDTFVVGGGLRAWAFHRFPLVLACALTTSGDGIAEVESLLEPVLGPEGAEWQPHRNGFRLRSLSPRWVYDAGSRDSILVFLRGDEDAMLAGLTLAALAPRLFSTSDPSARDL